MALAVCAYPQMKNEDHSGIQSFRKEHDGYYSVVEPHFSFVFPLEEIGQNEFIEEIEQKSDGFEKIDFEIRCATVNKDAILDIYHLLLVPDKGYSNIVKLHDKLYSNKLFNYLRLDIDFIPHMGIANSQDKYEVKKWADEWNASDFLIAGSIESLMVVDYTDDVLIDLKKIQLK